MPAAAHPRPPGIRILTLSGLLCLAAGAGCGQARCPSVCQRARACRAELAEALVARLPAKSPALRYVRQKLPERMVPALLASCPQRCAALQKSRQWRQHLRDCAARQGCSQFARCLAPALEP